MLANHVWKPSSGGSQRAVSLKANLIKFSFVKFWGNGPLPYLNRDHGEVFHYLCDALKPHAIGKR